MAQALASTPKKRVRVPDFGLYLDREWAILVLRGEKTVELRGYRPDYRGTPPQRVGIPVVGTGHVYGDVVIFKVEQLTSKTLFALRERHCVEAPSETSLWRLVSELLKTDTIFAWHLRDARAYPVPFPHFLNGPQGLVTFKKK